jgi:hypothetical protein
MLPLHPLLIENAERIHKYLNLIKNFPSKFMLEGRTKQQQQQTSLNESFASTLFQSCANEIVLVYSLCCVDSTTRTLRVGERNMKKMRKIHLVKWINLDLNAFW